MIKRALNSPFFFRLIQFIAIVSLLIAVGASVKVYNLANCIADYNNASAAAGRARAESFERATNAEDELWLAVNDAQRLPPDQAKRASTDAFNRYIAERKAARDERQAHPLPAPPSKVCN